MTHLSGQRHAQQESHDGHRQCDDSLVPDDPVGSDLVYDGRHQSLQQAELQMGVKKRSDCGSSGGSEGGASLFFTKI